MIREVASRIQPSNERPIPMLTAGEQFLLYLWIALGSALGGSARYALGEWLVGSLGAAVPIATLVINVTGSFLIGFVNVTAGPEGRLFAGGNVRQFLMVGICGGYTTFSAFSLQTLLLMQTGAWLHAVANVISSVVCCLVAVWGGHAVALYLNRPKV